MLAVRILPARWPFFSLGVCVESEVETLGKQSFIPFLS